MNPAGSPATAHFEWGAGTTIDRVTPNVDLGSGKAQVPMVATITGLAPNTTYSYLLVATNGVGQTTSTIKTFTTPAS